MDGGMNGDIAVMWICAIILALVFALVCMCTDKFMRWWNRRQATKLLRMIKFPE